MRNETRNEGNETMTSETTIYGNNATTLATILEYITLPNHPFHAEAVRRAAEFVEAERLENVKRGQKAMQDQMQYTTEEEWAAIVD